MKTPPSKAYPNWSEARYWSFIRSALRSAYSRYPPKFETLNEAKRSVSGKGNRKWEYQCAICEQWHVNSNVSVDHIVPCGALSSYEDIPDFVQRLFCGKEGLRVLCNPCHKEVTAGQRNSHSTRVLYPNEESSYRNMKSRCTNPRATGYENYGGRGIKVCDRWLESFWNFLEDMGERPDGATLDRIDVNGNYEPSNCRWVDWEVQGNNKTDNVYITYEGETKTISQWARSIGLLPNSLQYRLYRGWTIAEALGKVKRVVESKKLIQGEVLSYVKEELAKGRTQTDIAKELGVDSSIISRSVKTNDERRGIDNT